MKPYVFKSFEQIELELEILSVERELSWHRMDQSIKAMRAPSLGGHALSFAAPIVRNLVMNWLIRKIRERFRRDD